MKKSLYFLFVLAAGLTAAFIALNLGIKSIALLFAIALIFYNFTKPRRALLAYIFLLPFVPFYVGFDLKMFGEMNGVRMLNVLFLFPLIFRYIFIRSEKKFLNRKLFYYDILIILFLIFSVLYRFLNYGFDVGKGGLYANFMDYFPIYFVITRYLRTEEAALEIIDTLIVSCLTLCLIGATDYLFGNNFYTHYMNAIFSKVVISTFGAGETIRASVGRMQFSFGQPLSLAIYLVSMHMLILFCFPKNGRANKIIYLATFLAALLCLLLTQSRGPVITDAIFISIALIKLKKLKIIYYLSLTTAVCLLIVYMLNIHVGTSYLQDIKHENVSRQNINFRYQLYESMFHNIKDVSWIGENKTLYYALPKHLQEDVVVWYFQILIDNGLITFFIFVLLMGSILKGTYSFCMQNQTGYVCGLFAALLSQLVNFLSVSFVGQDTFLFWVILGACINLIVREKGA